MDETTWNVLADLELCADVGHALAPGAWAVESLGAHAVPKAVSGRVAQAIDATLQRIFAGAESRIRLTILTPSSLSLPASINTVWGFFLVEKPADSLKPHQIEVFLYQESR